MKPPAGKADGSSVQLKGAKTAKAAPTRKSPHAQRGRGRPPELDDSDLLQRMAEEIVDGWAKTPREAAKAVALVFLPRQHAQVLAATAGIGESDLTPSMSKAKEDAQRALDATVRRLTKQYQGARGELEFRARATALARKTAHSLLTRPSPRHPSEAHAEKMAAELEELAWQAQHVANSLRMTWRSSPGLHGRLLKWAGDLLAARRWPPV